MRRFGAILLLCLYTFNLLGFILAFKVNQFHVRQEIKMLIKKGVPQSELTVITVTAQNENQLHWEHKKEFRYKGVMYDIVKKEVTDAGTTLYFCITDRQETSLFSNLDEQVEKGMNDKSNSSGSLKNLLKLIPVIASPVQHHACTLFPTTATFTFENFLSYPSPAFDIAGPPPKCS